MSNPTRRDFLSTTAAGALTLTAPGTGTARINRPIAGARSCIFINLVGGPSHIDTFDPKPNAPTEIRGPFRPIQTRTPGLHLSELFPKLAALSDKFSLLRSMHHTAPPIHEAGLQLLNTGRLFRDGPEWPSLGAVVAHHLGQCVANEPGWDVLPNATVHTGVSVGHGQTAGWLAPGIPTPGEWRSPMSLSECCDVAIERLCTGRRRFITINQFSTVFDALTWDCHADGGSLKSTLADIRNVVAPEFDTVFARLLSGLDQRGLLESTLVAAVGEFGRTPRLNSNGGRDHWAGAWTAIVAGGGVQGGRVVGRTDATGAEPADRPITPQELVATVYHAMGIPADATIPGPNGVPVAVYPARPVLELF
jgi:uncharacterized protein (DUF1501 family)